MSAPVITRVDDAPAVTALRRKDLLGIADLAPRKSRSCSTPPRR